MADETQVITLDELREMAARSRCTLDVRERHGQVTGIVVRSLGWEFRLRRTRRSKAGLAALYIGCADVLNMCLVASEIARQSVVPC